MRSWSTRRKLLVGIAVGLFACALLIGAGIVLYPKPRVIGGIHGMMGPGSQAYREDFKCLGIPYDFCPDWPDYGCRYFCYGLTTDRQCSIETFNVSEQSPGITRTPTACH